MNLLNIPLLPRRAYIVSRYASAFQFSESRNVRSIVNFIRRNRNHSCHPLEGETGQTFLAEEKQKKKC